MTKKDIEDFEILRKMSKNKMIKKVLDNYDEAFNYVIHNNKWCFSKVPIEVEDIRNIFLSKIPTFITQYKPSMNFSFKTFMCMKLKFVIFNEVRKQSAQKYKILNESTQVEDHKYSIKCIAHKPSESEIDLSVLSDFEVKVYLTIFEACRSTTCAAHELSVSKYKINQAIREIMAKMKKQLQ